MARPHRTLSTIHLNPFVQGHWGIETRLHYVRDWTYDEDRSQVRTQQGPQVIATLRNTAMGLLRHLKLPNVSRAVKHLDRQNSPMAPGRLLGRFLRQ